MYARRKGWPLTGVNVDITHAKEHAADAADPADAKVDHFDRTIRLEGDLSDAQRTRLLEIADKCPVHRTLERVSTVTTHLA
jgi:putative redox protein